MTPLSAFGLFAVSAMMLSYALESRSRWFILAFSASCVLGSIYGFLQGAWPFGIVEGRMVTGCAAPLVERVWSLIALRRWCKGQRGDT